jgi:hypothetical protein
MHVPLSSATGWSGSWMIFDLAGLEPWSSQSQLPKQLGFQAWATSTWPILAILLVCTGMSLWYQLAAF